VTWNPLNSAPKKSTSALPTCKLEEEPLSHLFTSNQVSQTEVF
jgi:hypothetical protein